MSKSARLACALMAVVPAYGVLALDPTLPQPGRNRSTPAASPEGQGATAETPNVAPAAEATATADVTPIEATPAERLPLPDADAQASAQRLVDQLYKDALTAARTPDAKRKLAIEFRSLASKSQPPGKYVLLLRARELAADAGDVGTALGTVADLERTFRMDGVALELDAVSRLMRVVRSTDGFKAITRHLLGSANQAVAGERFESARKLIDQAVLLSARSNDPPLARVVAGRVKEVREIEAAYQAVKPALDAVAAKSADPSQHLAAGRYKALYQGDFAGGLPLLAAGVDDPLKAAAVQELAGVQAVAEQDALGDAWYAIAEKLTGVAKNQAMLHAARFYAQAAPSLSGLQQVKAVKRAKEAESLGAMYAGRPAAAPSGEAATASTATPPTPPATTPPMPPGPGATPPTTTGTDAPTDVKIDLPPKFTRIWNSPELWKNKPEDVTVKGGRVSIVNENGANTVCENEPLVPQKDGSHVLAWDYGPDKTGYEIWSMKEGQLVIQRWNSKAEMDAGRPVRRVGAMMK